MVVTAEGRCLGLKRRETKREASRVSVALRSSPFLWVLLLLQSHLDPFTQSERERERESNSVLVKWRSHLDQRERERERESELQWEEWE